MNFLTPTIGIVAAAIAVPLLVLMYFLKLKRMEMPVSSTLLWRKAIQDLQVNAPFQRLRKNILLLLQLLVLAAVLFAMAGPMMNLQTGQARRYVLLIDRSGSMNATDCSGESRLYAARKQAKQFVNSLPIRSSFTLTGQTDQVMVLAFSGGAVEPKVLCNFTSDIRQIGRAIDSVEPTDGPSELARALVIARAFAQSPGQDANNRSSVSNAQLELFSDGRIADLDRISISRGELTFHRVGQAADNIAVTAMQARRSYEKPEEVSIFATLSNWGPAEASCDVQLSLDGAMRSVRTVKLPAASQAQGRTRPDGQPALVPGAVSISFMLTHGSGGVLEVRQLARDALADDDAAWTILQPPRRVCALLVTAGNPALSMALKACPMERFDTVSPGQFESMDMETLIAKKTYDLIILDQWNQPCDASGNPTRPLPPGRYLSFGRSPAESGVTAAARTGRQFVIDWLARHPVLANINLENLCAERSYKFALPADARTLAEFEDGPAVAMLHRQGRTFLLAGFDVMETNWPFEAGLVMFCYNAVGFLAGQSQAEGLSLVSIGQPIAARLGGGDIADIKGPFKLAAQARRDPGGSFIYSGTARAGV
ncbi:MAG: BatA domain-containing protein [Planctomycetes bacterium]|nr:BatA domain-containing protein [Planctomycetota bacterium]